MFLNQNNTLKWKWILVAAAIVAALCVAGALWLDAPIYFFIRRFDGEWAFIIDKFASFKLWVIVLFVVCGHSFYWDVLYQKKISDIKKYMRTSPQFLVLYSVLLAGAIGGILKIIIGRMRPIFLETFGQMGFYPFTNEWAFNSMPSGHTIATFAGFVMIGMLYPKFKPLTWTLAIIVGISRVAFGAHFPSDVLLGAFIGMLCADVVKSKLVYEKQ